MSSSDNISKWKEKSQIDYFTLFMPLWLSFNAWYKDKYHWVYTTDRDCINDLKDNTTGTNKIWNKFQSLIWSNDNFKNNLSNLSHALISANLTNDKYSLIISFKNAKLDNTTYENLIVTTKKRWYTYIELPNNVILIDNEEKLYKALLEIIYQVRCILFHGNLTPIEVNNRVIKYLYLILFDLVEDL